MNRKAFGRGDIVRVSLDPTIGREQQGFRPVLVLTDSRFNKLTGCPFVAAITNGGKFARENGLSVNLMGCGLQTTGVVRCDQVRSMDLSERGAWYVETVPDDILDEVYEILGQILNLSNAS